MAPSEHQNAAEAPNPDPDRLDVIANLLVDLPADQRTEVIAGLDPAERAAVARLLIGKGESGEQPWPEAHE